jgi:hypothetical protein
VLWHKVKLINWMVRFALGDGGSWLPMGASRCTCDVGLSLAEHVHLWVHHLHP